MPLLLGFGLVALFIWFGENAATAGGAWLDPSQARGWHPVGEARLVIPADTGVLHARGRPGAAREA